MSKSRKPRIGSATVVSRNSEGLSPAEVNLLQLYSQHKAQERGETVRTITVVPCTCGNAEYRGQAHVHFVVTDTGTGKEEKAAFGPVFLRPTGRALLRQMANQGFITPQQVEEAIPMLEKLIKAEHMVWPPNPALDGLEQAWMTQHQFDNFCQTPRK